MNHLKMYSRLKMEIFHCHVNLLEGIRAVAYRSPIDTTSNQGPTIGGTRIRWIKIPPPMNHSNSVSTPQKSNELIPNMPTWSDLEPEIPGYQTCHHFGYRDQYPAVSCWLGRGGYAYLESYFWWEFSSWESDGFGFLYKFMRWICWKTSLSLIHSRFWRCESIMAT